MTTSSAPGSSGSPHARRIEATQPSPQHYLRMVWHRKWLVLLTWLAVSAATFLVVSRLPNIFTSDTLILVDPQKVPETYIKSTVTGDIRNRLGTLSQQILSATRLQKIIETLNLYADERKQMAREDVIAEMRRSINVTVVSDFGNTQDLQAFRISYSGPEPRLVAQVTNELAALFIEENLKAREQQATGTYEFLDNQLQETRKTLEQQEAKLRDFKLKHVGEMPEQQTTDLQILGQMQSQLQLESEALTRAEQQKRYVESIASQASAPVVDLDEGNAGKTGLGQTPPGSATSSATTLSSERAKLAALMSRYTDKHPEVQKLKRQIEEEEGKAAVQQATAAPPAEHADATPAPAPAPARVPRAAVPYVNPVLEAQLESLNTEISKHQAEKQRLSKAVATYQAKLEAIPVNEQQITDLVRDYEMSKAHYSQLLDKQLSAQTATQLEIRQKGERFSILDPAQPAERPTKPNRLLLDAGGALGGLVLGLMLVLSTEFVGVSITAAEQVTEACGLPVLEVIPRIFSETDKKRQKKRLLLATATGLALSVIGCGAFLVYHYRN